MAFRIHSPKRQKKRARRDHVKPEGYLWGFVTEKPDHEQKPLWACYVSPPPIQTNRPTLRWIPQSPSEVSVQIGWYDYSPDSTPAETADQAFAKLERKITPVRDAIRKERYRTWRRHLPFLLRYGHMLQVRSELYREDVVGSSPGVPHPKNYSITRMREELKKGPSEMWTTFQWTLRFSRDPGDPFITGDSAPVISGDVADPNLLLTGVRTRCLYPLGWDMALLGRLEPWPRDIDECEPSELDFYRRRVSEMARRYLVSPRDLSGRLDVRIRRLDPLRPNS
jgi:hypothetical protein